MGVHKLPVPSRGELEKRYLVNREYVKDMALAYGVNVKTMEQWLKDYGLHKPRAAKDLPRVHCPTCGKEFQAMKSRRGYCCKPCAQQARVDEMNTARRKPAPPKAQLEGRYTSDIMAEFKVCSATVYAWLRIHGITATHPELPIPPREQLEGKSQPVLAEEFGVSIPTIRKWRKHYGLLPLPRDRKAGAEDKKPRKCKPKRPREVKARIAKPAPVKTKCIIPERPAQRAMTQEEKERKMIEDWLRDNPRV